MRRSPWLALAWAACLWAVPAAAQDITCELDVEQPLTGRGFYFSADTPRWQEFIPSRNTVCEVKVALRADNLGGDLLLRIEDDQGTILGQSSIDESQVVLGDAEYWFAFEIAVTPNETHRLVLSTDQPDVFPAPYFWMGDEASDYTDGISDVHAGGFPGHDYAFLVTSATLTRAPEIPGSRPFVLHDAVPNPFNPSTVLAFEMVARSHVRLTIHDMAGRLVTTLLDQVCDGGHREVVWNGQDSHHRLVASGVYVYRIQVGPFVEAGRATLVK